MNYALIGCGRIATNHIKAAVNNHLQIVAGRNALEMILAIYKSQKTGQPVKLPLTDFASTDMTGTF